MGYIKKLKNNELVGGTDKTTIYPVTSTKAVFEEVTEGDKSSFKSQETINKEQQDELDDHEERIQAAEAEDIKSITINGSTKKYEVDDENNVDLTIYTVDSDPEMPSIASNVEDLRNMVGTSTPILGTSHKTRIETLEGGDSVVGSVENKIKTKIDSINSSYQDDNEYVKYSMTQTSGEVTDFSIDETNLKNAITSLNTSISGDNIIVGPRPTTGQPGKIYRVINSSNNTYTDYMYSGGSWLTLATHDTSSEQAQVAYYTCTASGSGASATKQFVSSGSLTYTPSSGGHIKILMGEANTATGTIYLQYNDVTNTKKPLYYNGVAVSASNTWEAGETITVYYDPSANSNAGAYYASNAQGGGGKAEKIKYNNSQSGLAAENVQGAVDEVQRNMDNMLLEWIDMVMSSYSAAFRGIRYISNRWYWAQDGSPYSYTIPITGGKKYKIIANSSNVAQYTFLTSNDRGSGYYGPAFATGYSSVLNIPAGESLEITAPADATYLYLTQKIGSKVYTPSSLYNQKSKIDKLDELETTIEENKDETDEEIAELKESMFAWNDMDLLSYSAPLRGILYVNKNWYWTQDNSTYSYTIPITGGESYKIVAKDTNNAKYTFLTSDSRGSGYSTPAFATGYSSVLEIPAGEELVVKAPDNAAYLYLTQRTSGVTYTPKAIYNQISKFDIVDELKESSIISYPIDISKCASKRFCIKTISGGQYWEGHDYNSFSYLIDVTGVQKVRITAATNASAGYTFLKTDNREADSYVPPNFATGYSSVKTIEAGVTSDEIKVPSDAVYLYLHQYVGSVDHTPSQLLFMLPTVNQVGMNLDNINGLMEDVKETYYGDNKAFYDVDFTKGDVSIFNTNANWSVDSNGLTCTNPSNTIYTKHISSMSQKKTRLRFTLSSDGFVALCWANTGSSNGSYFSVDAANGLMSVHNNYSDSTSTPPSILSSANVTIIAGREYILEAIKERHNNTLRLYDGLSGSKVAELIANQASASAKTGGHQIGNLGIACVSGTVYIKRLQVVFDYIKPLIAVFGDSITEGDKVMQGVTYGDLLKEHFGDSRVVTSGKSGDTADGVTTRIGNEIGLLKPKYVMVTIGTNGGLSKYQLLGILADIHAVGAIPIICVPPLGGTTVESIRKLLAQYDFLSVRYDIATAVNNDVSQGQNSSIFADGLHPNAAGHKAMFDRIKIDVPELFDY